MTTVAYLACIASALSIAVSAPAGYLPGTDLHAIRAVKADKYVQKCKQFAKQIKDGRLITDPGFETFRELWQGVENAADLAEIQGREVWSVVGFRTRLLSDVLKEYTDKVSEERDLIIKHYSTK